MAAANADLETALAEADARYRAANPRSEAQYRRAEAAMPGGNTRTTLFYPPFPLTLARGEGCRVFDLDDHAYVDFVCEYTAGLYGHSDPVIRAAIDRALDNGIVMGGHIEAEARLAAALCDRLPSVELIRFTNSGTEANLMAIAAARAFTGRESVMVMGGGYHGGVLYFGFAGNRANAPFDIVTADYNDIEATRALFRRHGDRLACALMEPMMGAGGCIPAEDAFLAMMREETERCGALLIFDEVMTSRLSPGGLQQVTGIHPDLTTLGKYVGGGLSFGAFGGRADVMDLFDPRRADALGHAGTFNNNALTMNAGFAGLSEVFTPEAARALNDRGDRLRERLASVIAGSGAPLSLTGRGSMIGLHVRAEPPRTPREAYDAPAGLKQLLHKDLLAAGLYTTPRGMYVLSLPMGDGEADALVAGFEEFLASRRSLLAAAA